MAIKTSITPVVAELIKIGNFDGSTASVNRYAASILNLDAVEKQLALSTQIESAAERELVIVRSNQLAALQDLTIAQAAEKIGLEEWQVELFGCANANTHLTAEMIKRLAVEGTLTEEQLANIASLYAETAAAETAAAANTKLAFSFGAVAKAMLATPMGWIMLLTTVLPFVIKGVSWLGDVLVVTAEEARETADELHTAFNETTSELQSLNSELETANDRLEELLDKSEKGTLSVVEQQELDNLEKEVKLLEQRQRFLDAQAAQQAKESNDALEIAFDKETFSSDLYTFTQQALEQEKDALISIRDSWTDAEEERFYEIVEQLKVLGQEFNEGKDGITGESIQVDFSIPEYVQLLIDRYNELNSIDISDMTMAQLTELDILKSKLSEMGVVLTDYIQQYEGDSDVKDFWQGIADSISDVIFTDTITESSDEARASIHELILEMLRLKAEAERLGSGGNIDLTSRKKIGVTDGNIDIVHGWGMSDAKVGDYMTVASQTYTDAKTGAAILVTPILPNGELLTQDELDSYIDTVINNTKDGDYAKNDSLGITLGVIDDGDSMEENIQGAEDLALRIHDVHENLVTVNDDLTQTADKMNQVSSVSVLKGKSEEITKLNSALEDIQGATSLNLDDFVELAELVPEIAENGLTDIESVRDALKTALSDAQDSAKDAYASMCVSSSSWLNAAMKDGSSLVTALSQYYGIDDSNFTNLANSKYITESTLIADLSSLWAQYVNMTLQDVQTAADAYKEMANAAGASGNVAGATTAYNMYTKLNTIYELRKRIEDGFNGLANGKYKGGGGGSSKAVEEYIADIDEFREALERLRKAQEVRSRVKLSIDESDNLREQVILEKQLIGAYEREQEALVNLNNQRSKAITSGAQALRELGFSVSYNAEANELWIDNMEHLNELTATSKGEYGSLQEATNALRKDTEELIDSLTELNDDNRDAAENWRELKGSIKDAREEIKSLLNDVVKRASEAVDSIQNVYDTLHSAADEYAESGYITVDVLQSVVDLGVQYLSYLIDENGQLVINEKTIKDVIAAKTQQLAIESSLSYIESLRIAKMENDIETLENLLNATEQATDATWGFVYATLALSGLSDQEQQLALENINALRALADSAADGIGKTGSALKDSLSDILKYVMDMLKKQIDDQVTALEDMKDTYSDIIDMKKKSLEASKDEADYEKNRAKKLKEIASLQARIDILSLDDSRSAKAERSKLLEELAALQEELAEDQADRALEATKDALDEMEDAYHQEKDKEIEILENSISSYQKLYDMAISYIENHWDTLYNELISWNTEYGNVLNSEITTAWDNCLEAAKRYGSFVSALENVGSDSGGQHYVVGNTNYDSSSTKTDRINAAVAQMKENSALWVTASPEQRKNLSAENVRLAKVELAQYGVEADIDQNGVWHLKDGRKLYDVYHTGGVVGRKGSIEDNEVLAKLEKDEVVLTRKMWNNAVELIGKIEQYSKMSDVIKDSFDILKSPLISEMLHSGSSSTNNVTTNNNQPIAINFGDTIINGANQDAVEKHKAVDREMMNEIAKWVLGR